METSFSGIKVTINITLAQFYHSFSHSEGQILPLILPLFTTFYHYFTTFYHFLPLFYHSLSTFYRAEDFAAVSPPEVQNGIYRAEDFTIGRPPEAQPFLGFEGVVNPITFYIFLQLPRFLQHIFAKRLLFGSWIVGAVTFFAKSFLNCEGMIAMQRTPESLGWHLFFLNDLHFCICIFNIKCLASFCQAFIMLIPLQLKF